MTPDYLDDEELRDAFEVGKKRKFKIAHLNVDDWLAELHHDKQQLNGLFLHAKDVSPQRDAKLGELKKLIAAKVRKPTTDRLAIRTARSLSSPPLPIPPSTSTIISMSGRARTSRSTLPLSSGPARTRPLSYPRAINTRPNTANILTNFSPRSKKAGQGGSMPRREKLTC